MDFVSGQFLLFLAIGLIVFYSIPKKWQQYWLLLLSVLFYCAASVRLFGVMLVSVGISYAAALSLEKTADRGRTADDGSRTAEKQSAESEDAVALDADGGHERRSGRKSQGLPASGLILGGTAAILVGMLWFLKLAASGSVWAARFHIERFAVLLPIGISFYTLQMLSYLIDVSQGRIRAEKNPIRYLLFITYFPQILQGPIPRFDALAPQLTGEHRFCYETFVGGFELMVWGYFQKMVIADRANIIVNRLFGEYERYPGAYMLLAGVLYSIQLYTDFNGCVCIARGVSEMFGVSLGENFRRPYFATSIQNFWRRWHISLSNWLRDYIYIPLGGSRRGTLRRYRNIALTFAVSGLWHGVGLHYLIWGLLHGMYQIGGSMLMPARDAVVKCLHIDRESFSHKLYQRAVTFFLVMSAWIFFRADNVPQAVAMLRSMVTTFNPWILWDGSIYLLGLSAKNVWVLFWGIALLFGVSALQTKMRLRTKLMEQGIVFRYAVVLLAALIIFVFGIYGPGYDAAAFIYGGF